MQTVDTGYIVVDPEVLGGKPHIAGHRIGVSHVAVALTHHGLTPIEIADQFHVTPWYSAYELIRTDVSRVPPDP